VCLLCGGHLRPGRATIPFVLPETVVVIRDVPAEICSNCQEPFTIGEVTDMLANLLTRVRSLPVEVSIISYAEGLEEVAAR